MVKIIHSFDFDDTLCLPDGTPNKEMVEILLDHDRSGGKCYVVTARTRGAEPLPTVKQFIREHSLPVRQCHFTAGDFKGPLLQRLGVARHYDDCEIQVASARRHGVEAVLVPKKNAE